MSIFKTLVGFSLLLSWVSMVSASDSPSAYDMLEKFNFPRGILPEGVNGYVLHGDNTTFELYLDRDCKFQAEEGGYYLHYQKKITGKVSYGSLKGLQGVSVRILFVWIGITEVNNDGGGDLDFYVGPMSASFPITNFEESPQCGGGVKQLVSDS